MKKSIACLACLIAMNGAFAGDLSWNEHLGPFAEVNLGTNLYYLGLVSSVGSTAGGGVLGAGWSGALGYNFTNRFGLETGFMQNYGKIDDNSHINVPYATTRFTVPMGDRFSFIGKIGAMYPFASDVGAVLPFTGVGVSYAVTKKVDVSLQYQGAVYGIAGAGLAGVGLTYHFD